VVLSKKKYKFLLKTVKLTLKKGTNVFVSPSQFWIILDHSRLPKSTH